MSNTCFTEIEIHCDNQFLLYSFYRNMIRWCETEISLNDETNRNQFSNVAVNSLMTTVEDIVNDRCPFSLRGSIDYIKWNESHIMIDTETAWNPELDLLHELMVRELGTYATMIYRGIEEGNSVYVTNDPNYLDTYYFEYSLYDDKGRTIREGNNDHINKEELINNLRQLTNTQLDDIDSLVDKAEDEGYYISVNKWDFNEI